MKNIKYKAYSFKLNKKTKELLNLIRRERFKSWNLVFYELSKEHINHNKNIYRCFYREIYQELTKDKCEQCNKKNDYIKKYYEMPQVRVGDPNQKSRKQKAN